MKVGLISAWAAATVAVALVRAIGLTILTNIGIALVVVMAAMGAWSFVMWYRARGSFRELDRIIEASRTKAESALNGSAEEPTIDEG